MQKNLVNTLYALFFGLLFVTPLIHTGLTNEQYEYPKMFFVYFLLLLLFGFFALFYKERLSFGSRWVLFYVLLAGVSAVLAGAKYNASFGYYSRQVDGLLSILFFYGLYILAYNLRNILDKNKILLFSLLSQLPILLVGFWQVDALDRIYSTFGQPNWYGAYLVCLLPFTLYYAHLQKEKGFAIFWYMVAFANAISIFLTGSISALIALGALGIIFAFKFIRTAVVVGVLSAFFIGVVFNWNFLSKRFADVFTFSTDPQQYQVSDPGLIRAGLWRGTWNLLVSSPKVILIGVGPENFAYEYPAFRDNLLNFSSEWNFIMNKPHNFFLELLVEQGIIGFLAFMGVLFSFYKRSDFFGKMFLLAFCVTSFFGWPSVSLWVVFWVFMGGDVGRV